MRVLFRREPMTVPAVDPGNWPSVEAAFVALERESLTTVEQLESWLRRFSDLLAVLQDERNRRYVAMTCRTDDSVAGEAYRAFERDLQPKIRVWEQRLLARYAESPARGKLDARRYGVLDRSFLNRLALFRKENIPLLVRESELSQEYQRVIGAQSVAFAGGTHTIPQMRRFLEAPERRVRQAAWEAVVERQKQDRETLERIYDQLVELRGRIARNAGFENYVGYIFRRRERFEYTPADCRNFHGAVEAVVLPALRKRQEARRRALEVERLRPWDLDVDPSGRFPLRPFERGDELIAGCGRIFARLDPELGARFRLLADGRRLDVESRKGKAPGGYQTVFERERMPFIFMNASGVHADVRTLVHEAGHAFHTFECREEPLLWYRHAPTEFCEVASMGMEMLSLEGWREFYRESDFLRAKVQQLDHILTLLAWIATIDSFQHEVYSRQPSREERRGIWTKTRLRFAGDVDWSGLEEALGFEWHKQQHLFTSAFYYIEYGIAQIGALQLWRNARRDPAEALRRYRSALALGGSRPVPELFEAAGLEFGMTEAILAPLVSEVAAAIEECGG